MKIPEILKVRQNIYGTALGLTTKKNQDIKSIFPDMGPPHVSFVHIEPKDCLALLRDNL